MLPYTKYESSRPCGFGDEDFKKFSYIFQCKTFDPWGGTIFDPRGILSTIFLEDLQMFPYTKYESSRPSGFGEEDFLKSFPIYFNVKTFDPWGGAIFDPREILTTTYLEDLQILPYTKYESSRLCGFGEEEFLKFPYIFQCLNF